MKPSSAAALAVAWLLAASAATSALSSAPGGEGEADLHAEATFFDDTTPRHIELPRDTAMEFLNNLLPSLDEPTQTARRRNLAQQWGQFNEYFIGDRTPNSATYFGQAPGPCPLASAGHTDKCFFRACDMSASVRAITIITSRRVDQWINCDSPGTYPGNVWIYDMDFGALTIGGIYLDITPQAAGTDDVTPPAGWGTSANPSEVKYWNQFRVDFTLSEVQVTANLKTDIEQLRVTYPIGLTFAKHGVTVDLAKSRQEISSSKHAISFRSPMTFRANKACALVAAADKNPTVSPSAFDTTCVYRSDKVTPSTRMAYYRQARTESFLEGIVYDINLPRVNGDNNNPTAKYADDACLWKFNNQYATQSPGSSHDLDLGMDLDVGKMSCLVIFDALCQQLINAILNLIIGLMLQGLLCGMFNQLFFLNSGNVPGPNPGLINVGVRTLYKFMKKYVETPLSTKADTDYLEDVFMPNKFTADGYTWPHANCNGHCPMPDAIDFTNSSMFKSISLGLNNILGGPSTAPGYTNKLVIVEVIDLLTGNTVGDLPIGICPPGNVETCTLGYCAGTCDGDIKDELQLSDYPRMTWTGQPVFDGQIQLNGLLFKYLNTITTLNLLDNNFDNATNPAPEFTHTVMNTFHMDKFGMELNLVIQLTDGSWVHRPRGSLVPANKKRSIYMNTNVYVELNNLDFKIDLFLLLEGSRLNDKFIGSIAGNWPAGYMTKRLHCATYALNMVQIPRLQLSATLGKLEFVNFLGDLATVVQRGTDIFTLGYKQATGLYLPFLADNFARPKINDYLRNNTYDGKCGTRNPFLDSSSANSNCSRPDSLDHCELGYPYYFAANDVNRYINFYDSKIWNVIKGLVNNVIGGIPVRTGSVSINTLIDRYLDLYIPVAIAANVSVIKLPNNQAAQQMGNLDFPGNAIEIRSTKTDDNFFRISNFQVRNIETIHELSVYPTSSTDPREFSVFFKLGGGKIWDRDAKQYILNGNLQFKFHFSSVVDVLVGSQIKTYAEDQADFSLDFGNVTLSSNVYALINQNDMLDLKFGDVTKIGCILSLIDDLKLRTLFIAFESFRLNIVRLPAWRQRTAGRCGKAWNVDNNNPVFTSSIVMFEDCDAVRVTHLSDSLDYLAWEALWWGDKVNSMLRYLFTGVSNTAMKSVNALTFWNPSTVNCGAFNFTMGNQTNSLLAKTQNTSENAGEVVTFWEKYTADQINPRFPMYPEGSCKSYSPTCAISYADPNITKVNEQLGLPAASLGSISCSSLPNGNKPGACWEDLVVDDVHAIDLRNSTIVKEVQSVVNKGGQKIVIDALRSLAESGASNLTNMLHSYPNGSLIEAGRVCHSEVDGVASYCIDLELDLEILNISTSFKNSDIIPGFEIAVTRVRVLNLHTFQTQDEKLNLLLNYMPDQYKAQPVYTQAMYTLAHRIMFGGASAPLDVNVDLEVSVAKEFMYYDLYNTTAGKELITDTLNLGFKFVGFDLQVMTTTAINKTRLNEIPFAYMLDPMSSDRCFFSIFYRNGLTLPQLQLQIEDLIGPAVNIKPKTFISTNPVGKPNIFSAGTGYLITSVIEIGFQLIKNDIADVTQGSVRSYVNRVLDEVVLRARDASGPGSCPLPKACGPPSSMCHYQAFNNSLIGQGLKMFNEMVGGDPVALSAFGINNLLDKGLDYALLDPTGLLVMGDAGDRLARPEMGTWLITDAFSYANGVSSFKIKNVGIKGLDSIYKLTVDSFTTEPYTLGLNLEMGNGTMINGSRTAIPVETFKSEPFVLQLEIDMKVVATRPGPTFDTLADNAFRVELRFANVSLESIQELLVNKTDLYSLNLLQVSKTQCVMALVDKVSLETIQLQLGDFDVGLPTEGGRANMCTSGVCKMTTALELLRLDAARTNDEPNSVPLSMMNLVLGNVGTLIKDSVNTATIFNQTLLKCEVPKVVFQITNGVYTTADSNTLINHLLVNMTGVLANPRPRVNADFTAITLQSNRASTTAGKTQFIKDVIASAKTALGYGPRDPQVVLAIGTVCDMLEMPALARTVCGVVFEDKSVTSNFSSTLEGWIGSDTTNYIDAKVPPAFFESQVRVDDSKDTYYDVRTSVIARSVSNYFGKTVQALQELLRGMTNATDMLRIEPDNSITFVANMTDLMLMMDEKIFSGKTCEGLDRVSSFHFADLLKPNSDIIPNLSVLPGMLEITNFGSFSEIMLFKPYAVGEDPSLQAKFTTQQQIGWRNASQPLGVSVSIDLFYDYGLTNLDVPLNSGRLEKETITVAVVLKDLYIQVLALLAVDTTALGYIRLGDFLNIDSDQKVLRNCKAMTCLLNGIFDGGMSLPQLSLNVSDIVGPTFQTTNNLFTEGTEAFIEALLEMGAQLFRDDLSVLTQGPLRSFINNKLSKLLGDSKVAGACPERRNYTRDYPFGPEFCSHHLVNNVSTLTQTRELCQGKTRTLNGPTCEWAPPDISLTATTVACFYTKSSKDLNFQSAKGLDDLKYFVDNSLLAEDSALNINGIMKAFASNLKSKMFQLNDLPLKYNGGDYGKATIGVGNFRIVGLNTVDRLQIFDNAPYGVNGSERFKNSPEYEASGEMVGRRQLSETSDGFGYLSNKFMTRTAIGFIGPLDISMRLLLDFTDLFIPEPNPKYDDGRVINDVTITISLHDVDIVIDLFMLINIPRLMDLQVRSIGTIYELPCILEIFEENGLVPVQFNVTYGGVGFDFCATPGGPPDYSTGRVDSPMLSVLGSGCFSDSASTALADSFSRQLQKLTDYLIQAASSSGLQSFLNSQISSSNTQCEAIKAGDIKLPDYTTDKSTHEDAASAMGIVGLGLIFVIGVVFALLVPVHFRRRDELMKRALLDAHERGAAGKSKDEFELAERRLQSAFAHPCMPKIVKWGVLAQIGLNVIYFATANFGAVGCTVELGLSIAGSTTKPIALLSFGLAGSVNDMWNSGAYPLAVIIALASGAWPYGKQILLLFAWLAPSTILHPLSRGRLLEVLDMLGKWSMIDIYVLVIMMVAFRFYLTSSMVESLTLLPSDVVEVNVVVGAGWGMYGFCLGAMGSLLVNHVMVWYNRKIIRADEDFQDAILGTLVKDLRTPRIPLSKHRFNILDAEGRPYRFSAVVRILVVFSMGLVFLAMIIGCAVETITFTFRGVAGLAINLIDPESGVSTQSVMSIGAGMISGAKQDAATLLGVIFLQILYVLFSLILPLILIIVLLVIWLVPLTLREQILLYFVAEVLSAWEACIILIISFVAAMLQISVLAQFIVENATAGICNGIKTQLAEIFPDPMDAQCFDVTVHLLPMSGFLWFGTVGLVIFGGYAFRLMEAAIHDRELAMRRKPPHSPGEMTGCQGFYVRRSLEAFGQSQIQDEKNAGGVANAFAQNQGAFSPHGASMQVANPVMSREMEQGGSSAPNPMFSGPASMKFGHASIDV
ncbi:hypothetical protein BASA81_007331 [Batrachochytrium salamandrivorans]|nr:hypothetical protein BASA81_007331 [Batrachochytrium salamandrivorans]